MFIAQEEYNKRLIQHSNFELCSSERTSQGSSSRIYRRVIFLE